MKFALFIGFSFLFLFNFRKEIPKKVIIPLVIATITMALFCGVRSVIAAIGISTIYYLIVAKQFKIMLAVASVLVGGSFILEYFPEMATYLGSITDINNASGNVGGSSFDMRFEQLEGAINEMKKNPIWGLGYEWTSYYISKNGSHPVCLCFESLLYNILCNNGIIGIIVWVYMIISIFKYNKSICGESYSILNSTLVFYLAYSCITGENGYMQYYLIFYVIILSSKVLQLQKNSNGYFETV